MGIFGSEEPKFVVNYGLPGAVTVNLDHAVVEENEPDGDKNIKHEASLSVDRDFIYRGRFWRMFVRVNLFKYADPLTKFNEIALHEQKKVALYRHRDGAPFKDKDGNIAYFFIYSITHTSVSKLDDRDILLIEFLSEKDINQYKMVNP